jgi:hypothetical protein
MANASIHALRMAGSSSSISILLSNDRDNVELGLRSKIAAFTAHPDHAACPAQCLAPDRSHSRAANNDRHEVDVHYYVHVQSLPGRIGLATECTHITLPSSVGTLIRLSTVRDPRCHPQTPIASNYASPVSFTSSIAFRPTSPTVSILHGSRTSRGNCSRLTKPLRSFQPGLCQ